MRLKRQQRKFIKERYGESHRIFKGLKVNKPLVLQTYAWVRQEHLKALAGKPSEWDQSIFISSGFDCGTSCCVAGKIALDHAADDGVRLDGFGDYFHTGHLRDLPEVDIIDYAAGKLGINRQVAGILFNGGNQFADIKSLCEILVGAELRG